MFGGCLRVGTACPDLGPGIHVLTGVEGIDGRDEPGHDEVEPERGRVPCHTS